MTVERDPEVGENAKAPDRAKERRERAQARSRKDILEAALRAFEASGYRDTKMADIAAEAGYTAASLYTYFASKQDIIAGLADMLVDELVQAWGPVPEPSTEPVDFDTFALRFEERVRGVLEHIDRRSEGLAFFIRLRWSPEADAIREAAVAKCGPLGPGDLKDPHENKMRVRLEAVLQGIGLTQVTAVDPSYISGVFGGFIQTMILRGMLEGAMPRFADQAKAITDFLIYGIRGKR